MKSDNKVMTPAQKAVATFKGWMRNRGYSEETISIYAGHVAAGYADPAAYLRSLASWQRWSHARDAWRLFCQLGAREDVAAQLLAIPGPRKPPRKPIKLPDVETWRQLGQDALEEHPGPLGAVLWLVYYSGLRLGDILTITYDEAKEACRGTTTIRQKGVGGVRRRTWRAMWFVRPALELLLKEPRWSWIWCTFAPNQRTAAAKVRAAIPRPWHPHVFRHVVITMLHAEGVSVRTIMEVSGHESLSSLSRYLDFVPDGMVDDAHDKLGGLLFGRSSKPGGGGLPRRPPAGRPPRKPTGRDGGRNGPGAG